MGCAGKVRHRSKGMARDALRRAYAQAGMVLYAYPCSTCHGYHLSSLSPEAYRAHVRGREERDPERREAIAQSKRIAQGQRWHARTGR